MSAINPISGSLYAWNTQPTQRADFTHGPDFPGRVIRVRPIPTDPFAGRAGTVQPTDPSRPTDPTRGTDSKWGGARSTSVDRPAPRSGSVYQTNADGDSVTLSSKRLSPEEQEAVNKLRARDREVRTHEEAHKAAAGALYRGGPYYDYQTGPDGQRYAVGGRVAIDTSPADTPEATIAKARKIRASALAPAEPSSTDRQVAAKAAQMEARAHAELATNQSNKADPTTSPLRKQWGSTPSYSDRQSPRPTLDLVA
ncbi:MAG: putative metalloprotease CJM1_0395 family protein [Phycisphaerales bacterium JB040]